ncbi:hypothetical protein SIN8267_03434 [Sinobacterium norvegicum]|uniref:DUF4136 domain-containing protein n=1 Tax=Sinobacterium norvegicum TaxID=1641715 RepID=A0ABN8ELM4_9GAMM|nr:DUF4136 domain-containing protein [Sinobacterium norvegicum]CAH0993286.1 hypothetical protein SIN8267_03434 [Sinobacterium norvegicum]
MKTIKAILATAALAVITACSSVNINTDYTQDYDFSQLKTYSWHSSQSGDKASLEYLGGDIFDQRTRDFAEQSLTQKGMNKVKNSPDFLINYGVLTEDRTDINTYNTYSGYAPNWRYGYYGSGYGMGASNTQTTVRHYKQGTLMIDIIDPSTDKLVWRGTADGRLSKNMNPEERRKSLQKVVNKILDNFPPKD